ATTVSLICWPTSDSFAEAVTSTVATAVAGVCVNAVVADNPSAMIAIRMTRLNIEVETSGRCNGFMMTSGMLFAATRARQGECRCLNLNSVAQCRIIIPEFLSYGQRCIAAAG